MGQDLRQTATQLPFSFDDESLLNSVREYDAKLFEEPNAESNIQSLLYRPFDFRKIYYHKKVIASRSWPTMKHVLRGANIGLIACSTWTTPDRFSVGVSQVMIEMKTGTHDRGTTFFPLYRYDNLMGEETKETHNLTREFIEVWCEKTRTKFNPNRQRRRMHLDRP